MALFKQGPNKKMVKLSVALSWPLMQAAKRLSGVPVLKWIIAPVFARRFNQVTAIPINAEVAMPDSVALPSRILEEVLRRSSDIFILDECICRGLLKCKNHPADIGCMALGPAARRMHPSHGRFVTVDEGIAHVRRAAAAGLVASMAHVWIDPAAFWTVPFSRLMFICYCDDCCCLYRTHMKHRGPALDRAYRRLPGISVTVDPDLCDGCGICVEHCFVGEMTVSEGHAVVSPGCKGCGRCFEACPKGALRLEMEDMDLLVSRMMERIGEVADITGSRIP
jgi:ferredoxin